MMSLKEYKKKRNFKETSEPEAKEKNGDEKRFVIQEHWASHHHFDFRLEMEGVLKSWAVPEGIPEDKKVKRLAIQTEDHPVDYINFEGEIPEGQYGAGKVEIFDKGHYELEEIDRGKIIFRIRGEKIQGKYALIRTKKENQWILFKVEEN